MKAIADLIREYCPNGVVYREIGEYLGYEQPTKYLVDSTDYDSAYPTPVLTAGKTFILGYTDEDQGIYAASKEQPVIIFDDFTTAFRWIDFPFKAKSSAIKMLKPLTGAAIDFRYLYYAMCCIRFTPSEHARHWISKYSTFRIPVPPLQVQREIVRVLDTFQELEAELEAELGAELGARTQQHAFYRDSLFEKTFQSNEVKKLGEIGEIFRGRRFVKDDICLAGVPAIHYGEIYTKYTISASETFSFVTEEIAKKLRFAKTGDVILVSAGETIEDIGKAVAWLGDTDVVIHDALYGFRSSLDAQYVSHFFSSTPFRKQLRRHITTSKISAISPSRLAEIVIPIPPQAEQRRIAEALNNFERLVTDLSVGLPAELNARRQQYEFYRDRLLSFEAVA